MTDWKVPLFELDFGPEEHAAVTQVMGSNWITMGAVSRKFERAFADYVGVKHAFAVNSGTAALHLAHFALDAGQGDEVICPSLTFVATANAIVYTGATPVFSDITSVDDLCVSPGDIEAKITEKTKGISVVHYAGFPCNMEAITAMAEKYGLYVVEDAAHAPGAEYHFSSQGHTLDNLPPKRLGTIGDVGCFSFFGNKNMTTGEGGMVVTNHDHLAEKIARARSHGMTSLTWDRFQGHSFGYDVVSAGYNYRIDDLRSAIGLVQLDKLDHYNEKRRILWERYCEGLGDTEGIHIPFKKHTGKASYHVFPVILSKEIDRNAFMNYLKMHGIQSSIHYLPVHHFTYYKELISENISLELTEYIGNREVTLPLFPTMKASHVVFVVETIKNYINAVTNAI